MRRQPKTGIGRGGEPTRSVMSHDVRERKLAFHCLGRAVATAVVHQNDLGRWGRDGLNDGSEAAQRQVARVPRRHDDRDAGSRHGPVS